jgi:hypothetical protein
MMASREKRQTVLPPTLWPEEDKECEPYVLSDNKPKHDEKQNTPESRKTSIPLRPTLNETVRSHETAKDHKKSQSTRFPVKASVWESKSRSKAKPKSQYHRSFHVDQAGKGVISLKDVEGFPVCLMKKRSEPTGRTFQLSQPIIHKNLVSLVDTFYSQHKIFLVYSYEHLAVSLGCVAGAVQFNEADIATICKELLEGLVYLHETLEVAHGFLDCSNIILNSGGEVKIGKYR